jgi:nitrogen fixation protein FixH
MFKVVGGVVLAVAVLVGVVMGGNALSWWSYSVFAPKMEQVRNKTYHESQSYNDGVAGDVADAIKQWPTLDAAGKDAIRIALQQELRSYDTDKLPPRLREFYYSNIVGE